MRAKPNLRLVGQYCIRCIPVIIVSDLAVCKARYRDLRHKIFVRFPRVLGVVIAQPLYFVSCFLENVSLLSSREQ